MIDNITLLPIIKKYLKDEEIKENEGDIVKLCNSIMKLSLKPRYSLEKLQVACYCINISLKTYLAQEKMAQKERIAKKYGRNNNERKTF